MEGKETTQDYSFSHFGKFIKHILIMIIILYPLAYFFFIFPQKPNPILSYTNSVVNNYLILITLAFILAITATNFYNKNSFIYKKREEIFILLFVLNVAYAFFLFLNSVERYNSFASQAIDVPYFHYALVQLSNFKIPFIWDIPNRYVWADHISFILIFLAPIYWIAKSAAILMAIETLIVLSGAIPLYCSAKNVLKSRFLALSLVTAYLTFGGLQYGYAYGFHEIVLFPTFFFWMYYFYIKEKVWFYFAFVLLTLFIKEEVSFIMIAWGAYIAFFQKKKIYPIGTILLGIFWLFLCFYILFPYFTQGESFGYWNQYAGGKDGIAGMLISAFADPVLFLHNLITPFHKIVTIFYTFGPFAFLPLFYPPSILIITPSLLEKIASNGFASYNGLHYSSAIAGVTLIACIETLKFQLNNRFKLLSKLTILRRKEFWVILIIYSAVSSSILYGYLPLSPFYLFRRDPGILSYEELTTLQNTIDSIPKSASISAHSIIIPHLDKPLGMVKHGPQPNDDADYIIWDNNLPDYLYPDPVEKVMKSLIFEQKKYEIAVYKNNVILLKRIR